MANKIRILHVRSSTGKGGGPEKTIINSARFIDLKRFEMVLLYLKSENDDEFDMHERAKQVGVELIVIQERRKIDIRALKKIKKILHQRQIHIYHAHGYKSNFYGLILKTWGCDIRLVTTVHGWVSKNRRVRLYDKLDKRIQRFFSKVIIVTATLKNELLKYKVKKEKIVFIANSIVTTDFTKGKVVSILRQELNIPENAFVVGAVGRLASEKGYDTLIHSASKVIAKFPNTYFLIVGEGSEKKELQQMVHNYNLENKIIFPGYFSDIRQIFAILNLYVLSSLKEGLPNVILEAMAMEVPIVTTPVDGVVNTVIEEKHAIYTPVKDKKAMAENIMRIITNPELAENLKKNARKMVEDRFCFLQRMKKIENIYAKIIDQV